VDKGKTGVEVTEFEDSRGDFSAGGAGACAVGGQMRGKGGVLFIPMNDSFTLLNMLNDYLSLCFPVHIHLPPENTAYPRCST
jgi:hypothetical protein